MSRLRARHLLPTHLWLVVFGLIALAHVSHAQAPTAPVAPAAPQTLQIQLTGTPTSGNWGPTLNVVFVLTLMSLGPAILMSVTSFTRVLISLHFLRQAIGTQTAPGNQTLVGLSLFITYFIMAPTLHLVHEQGVQPFIAGTMDAPAALEACWEPLREFMIPQTRTRDLELFQTLAELPSTATPADLTARVLIPAFMISEIKTAFQIGILLHIPFLLLDMIVASVLLALGMMQLPPIVISTPLKLVLFVVVDGWHLVIGSLVRTFH